MLSPEQAAQFGFEWRADDVAAAPVQVTRLTELPAGRRVVGIATARAGIEVYVTRTGLIRVFRDGKELR